MAKETKTGSSTDNEAKNAVKAAEAETAIEEPTPEPEPEPTSAPEPEPAASTSPQETLSALQEELSRGLGARRVVLVPAPAAGESAYIAAVQLDRQLKEDDRVAMGQRLVTRGAAAGCPAK